jgi:membrane protein
MKSIFNLIKVTFSDWSKDHASSLAAALAYYTVFSLAPLLILVIAIAGFFGGQANVQSQILSQIQGLVGTQGRQFVESLINATNQNRQAGTIATVLSTITLILGAIGVFGQLQYSLNTIWGVQLKPVKGLAKEIISLIFQRLLSFAMVLGIGFLLLVSLVVNAALAFLVKYLGTALPIPPIFLGVMNLIVSFIIITLLIAMIYKFLPDAKTAWRDIWLGAAITALLFIIGNAALGIYLGRSSVGSVFGAAGSLAIILIWIYYSAQILFFGAEFTQVYANQHGTQIVPDERAEWIVHTSSDQGIHQQAGEATKNQPQPALQGNTEQQTGSTERQPGRFVPAFAAHSDREKQKGFMDRVTHYLILATQFIPAVREMAVKRAKLA